MGAERKYLTDRTLKALAPAKAGSRYEVWDTTIPAFGVRVNDTADKGRPGKAGRISFILYTRVPGKAPSRRVLGQYGVLTLEEARTKAGDWLKLIQRGTDPGLVEERARQSAIRKQTNSFAAVAEDFIAEKLPSERKGKEVERDIRREFIPHWGKLPITEISDIDIVTVIKAKKKTAPAQARNLLGHAKRLFGWAVDQRCYGLTASPAETLKPTSIVGEKLPRTRTLTDREMFAFWRAVNRIPYPYGPVYRLLTLTALRLNEVADATWSEFDLTKRTWTVPEGRMKGKNRKARSHAVPLTDEIWHVIENLPRFKHGQYLFSTTFGKKPVWMSDKIKKKVDARMLRTLQALARREGEVPAEIKLAHWENHDIRRTVRSKLSSLRISEEAREAVLAHARPGIKGVYDHHDYLEEKTEALKLWAAKLRTIVEPAPANVVSLQVRA